MGVIAGPNCRIAFPYLDSTLGPIHLFLFLEEDGIIINYVWSLPCPQQTCTTLRHGSIKNSLNLQKNISSTYTSLAEESERNKETKRLFLYLYSSLLCFVTEITQVLTPSRTP
jgi:hypothetical protein